LSIVERDASRGADQSLEKPGHGPVQEKPGQVEGRNGVSAEPAAALPRRDVRRKRPPGLSFLLRVETVRRIARVASLLILDYVGVAGAMTTAMFLKLAVLGDPSVAVAWQEAHRWTAFAYLVTVLMFARVDLYADRPHRPGFGKITSALFLTTVISLVFALASGQHFNSYYIFYGSWVLGSIYVTLLRDLHTKVTGWLLTQAGYSRRTLIVGSGHQIEAVAQAFAGRSRTDVDVIGYISLTPRPENGLRSLGRINDLPEILAEHRIQEVILADPAFPQAKAVELADLCHERGVDVHVAPTTMEILLDRAEFVPGASVPLFRLRPPVFEGIDYALKRTFDLVVAGVVFLVLSPVLLVIAIAVKLSSPGPIIFRSVRPGIGGKPFACFKFRTMREHAERVQDDLETLNEQTGALFKIREDPRLTGVGRFLRRYSLDELPQLVNVLRGEMSLVGPRPLPMRDYERLEEWHKKRYLVLPGITGLWQVSGRSELDFDDLVRLDFLYLEQWSIMLDLSILLKTVPALLSRRGAF
jgi:exopolysaccharide biosynthesis polyprenyl glycosylphosphotransferase